MNLFKKLMLWIALIILIAAGLVTFIGWSLSAPGYEGATSDHFDGSHFNNIAEIEEKDFFDVLKWYAQREPGEWNVIPLNEVQFAARPETRVEDGLVITYVNHSTFLIQTNGLNILTDPVWSDRVSPFSFAGPKRMRPPGLRFEDLPKIDLVLISHNHYDHLDIETLEKLKTAHDPLILVPLGVDRYLEEQGITHTRALDWWDEEEYASGSRITSVPAQHFSGRGTFDRNLTLWTGYVIQTDRGPVYFAGDTGYGDLFKEIGKTFGPIKVGLIPIGAYKPRWFMSPVHLDPAEAIQVHKDIMAEISFGMHYGTFPLADDGQYDPQNDFAKAIQYPENAGVNFKLLEEGDSFSIQ